MKKTKNIVFEEINMRNSCPLNLQMTKGKKKKRRDIRREEGRY